MLNNKNIIYFFVSGRKDRIQNNDVMAKEFFYGYHHFKKSNSVEIIEFNDNLAKPNNLRILKFLDKVIRKLTLLPVFLSEILSLLNLKKINESDHIVITNDRIGCSILPMLIYLKFFKKSSCTSSVFILGLFSNIKKSGLHSIFQKFYLYLFFKTIDNFIFIGEGEHTFASNRFKKYQNKFSYLPFAIDANFWTKNNQDKKKIEEYILFVGNDSNREFIKVIEIAKNLPEINFKFVTTQINEKEMNLPNVELVKGHWNHKLISDEDLRDIYQNAVISILPLKNTLQPSGQSVALQSMSMEIPVMISDTDGFWDKTSFFHEENIFFVGNNTVDNWTTELKKLYSDRKKINIVGKKGKSTIVKRFNLDTFYKGLEEIMSNTI